MKSTVLNFLYSVLATVLGMHTNTGNSKGLKPATSAHDSDNRKEPYIRDSEEGETPVEKTVKNTVPPEETPVYRVYSKEHVEALKKVFPHKRWNKDSSLADLAFSSGQQSIIDSIESRLKAEGIKAHVLQ